MGVLLFMEFRHEVVIPNDDMPFKMFIFEGKDGNYRVTKHWHRSVEIFLVKKGNIDFYINSTQHSLYEDDFVLVNANDVHSIESPDPNITIVLQFPVECFDGYMDDDPYITFIKQSEEDNRALAALVTDLYQIYERQEYGYKLLVKARFFELLHMLLTRFRVEQVDKAVLQQKRHLSKLSKVTQYMKQNYNEELALEEVAYRFGFSPTYLSRMFHKYAQVGYRTYLMDLRVKYAFRELVNTSHTISDIAMEHGFPDSRSLAKAFKKRYGCLPSEYRKRMTGGGGLPDGEK